MTSAPTYLPGASAILLAQGFQGDVLGLVLHSGPMAQVVLLILSGFSVISWAIMAERYRAVSRADKEDSRLRDRLRTQASLADLRDLCERLPFSPMAHVYRAGFREMSRGSQAGSAASTLRIVERAMVSASSESQSRLERFLGFLASTAAAAPFIGLFGTVWGIMNAFRSIGLIGTANLATVAPGISEALITTAAGLAAAIPAVLGYNYFNNRLRATGNRLDNFIADALNRFEKSL